MKPSGDGIECGDGLDLDCLNQMIIDSKLIEIQTVIDRSADIYIFDEHDSDIDADPIDIISSQAIQKQDLLNIDGSLAKYYEQLGDKSYIKNKNGNGLFGQYVNEQQLNDPIESELGDDCNPGNCHYVPFIDPSQFPIPAHLSITGGDKKLYIFYVLQYCYKYYHPPSPEYIEKTIMSKMESSASEQPQNA